MRGGAASYPAASTTSLPSTVRVHTAIASPWASVPRTGATSEFTPPADTFVTAPKAPPLGRVIAWTAYCAPMTRFQAATAVPSGANRIVVKRVAPEADESASGVLKLRFSGRVAVHTRLPPASPYQIAVAVPSASTATRGKPANAPVGP